MAFFDSLTDSIKQKWLQFFQVNRDWIILQMAVESVYTPDGGKRPSSYLILGVVNALEPRLAQLMFPFAKLNPDADTLIDLLGLHFDPDIVLGNRLSPTKEPEMYSRASETATEYISEPQPSAIADFSVIDLHNHQWEEKDSLKTEDGFNAGYVSAQSLSAEFEPASIVEGVSEFTEMSFDSISLTEDKEDQDLDNFNLSNDNGFDNLNQENESAFSDVISDVWGDDSSLEKGEENNNLLGEELPSEVFDESEMARLFPNN
ncbi:DUF5331 domain-containing protein [Sphaerospermopsis torques-reginae]|jgi:hypothetical protein|uniref:DUF5331 domain-containing protein n=1 Tax=Sphaerospermopsis torques-reginae ITEP-024 TaxID=984208 RepID=A0ABX8WZ03_9CYAN|nr:DUF5331 domain-containing protein [Sphaerospermopsis torques-reginae]QYX31624.1 DUF5331 domain-containing protein [Sphaerospermopsis torques-reginae ITEP-024]